MLKNKLRKRLLILGVVGTLMVSSAVVAFASTTSSTTKSAIEGKFDGGHRGFSQGGNPLTAILAKEVTAGVLTQSESDAITTFMKTKEATDKTAREALKTKLDAMTAADKKAYLEANKPVKTDVLSELVTANLLTQAQSDTIKAAMPQRHESGKEQGKQQGNPLTAVLAKEVTDGVITQAESDSATAFLKTNADAAKATRDADKAKFDAMTDAEKKAYFEANKPVRDNILADLVTANIFTQAQADTIQTAMKATMPKMSEMGKKRGEASTKRASTNGTTSTVTE